LGVKVKWNRNMTFNNYIRSVVKYGKCSFTIEQAQKALGKTRKAVLSSIEHLLAKGELASPARGFYVIVPPEYQILGCIPAEHFIPYLMDYWNCRYYVSLLTAARYHGASHQAVQTLQVMVEKHKLPLTCGKVRVQFIVNKQLTNTPTQTVTTSKSKLTISTPESTAMDILNYQRQSGGLNHIVTVLAELHEAMDPKRLLILAENSTTLAWQQRLGYLLEIVKANELAEVLKIHLAKQKRIDYIPLMSGLKISSKEVPRNAVWKIIENTTVESDI
jgi:predicted transcriptional regulator of viral defense system